MIQTGNIFTFNHDFYKTTYTDLAQNNITTRYDLLFHYLKIWKTRT